MHRADVRERASLALGTLLALLVARSSCTSLGVMNPTLVRFVAELKPEQQGSELRAELRELATDTGYSELRLLDSLVRIVAERYLTHEFTHAEAMARAAQLYDCAFPNVHPERLLYKVYWALDEAEYGLETDRPGEEASESRCRVRVGEVLASCPGNDA